MLRYDDHPTRAFFAWLSLGILLSHCGDGEFSALPDTSVADSDSPDSNGRSDIAPDRAGRDTPDDLADAGVDRADSSDAPADAGARRLTPACNG